jgi:hypothetical protein
VTNRPAGTQAGSLCYNTPSSRRVGVRGDTGRIFFRGCKCPNSSGTKCLGKRPSKEPSRRVRYDRAQLIQNGRAPARITPYPTGRLFWGGVVPGTSCLATIVLSRDISQQPLAGSQSWSTGVLGVLECHSLTPEMLERSACCLAETSKFLVGDHPEFSNDGNLKDCR